MIKQISAILLALASQALAQAFTLLPPEARWITGETVEFKVLAEGRPVPENITITATGEEGLVVTMAAALLATDGVLASYRVPIPADLKGRQSVRLAADHRAPYLVEVMPAAIPVAVAARPVPTSEPTAGEVARRPAPVEFTWVDAFYTHDPLYFVAGATEASEAKFQVSFKYQIYTPTPGLSKRLADGWLAPSGLYLGYTQTSLWDIAATSSPFRDTNYKPGVYWQERDLWVKEGASGRARLALMGGLEHESNGRSGGESRSINLAVLRPSLGYVTPGRWRFLLSPKAYVYLEKTDNPDIAQYRGQVDLHATVRMPSADVEGGLQLSLLGRLGNATKHGSLQADLTYPIRFLKIPGYLNAQIFTGYGETMLDYNKRRATQYRLGFAAIR
jgi:outer membrane phospholipase A